MPFPTEPARLPASLPTLAPTLVSPLRLTKSSSPPCPASPGSCGSSSPCSIEVCGRSATDSTTDDAPTTQLEPALRNYVLGGMDKLEDLECIGVGGQGSVCGPSRHAIADVVRWLARGSWSRQYHAIKGAPSLVRRH